MEKVQCKECEEMGHYARDCPNKKCRTCEKPGHHSRECPVISPNRSLLGLFPVLLLSLMVGDWVYM